MGTFNVAVSVGNMYGGGLEEVAVMVDAGAFHTALPASLLDRLRVSRLEQRSVELADGSRQVWHAGQARIVLQDQDWVCPVLFGAEDSYLLGATTLEIFNLMVDPMEQRLVHKPPIVARPI